MIHLRKGINKRYLAPNQYVTFSKQAYGAVMIGLCMNQDVCETPGDEIAYNSTEGGEVPLLFFFPQLQQSNLFLFSQDLGSCLTIV